MITTFACPCGKQLRVKSEHAGKRVKCTKCGQTSVVPSLTASSRPPSPPIPPPLPSTHNIASSPAQPRGRDDAPQQTLAQPGGGESNTFARIGLILGLLCMLGAFVWFGVSRFRTTQPAGSDFADRTLPNDRPADSKTDSPSGQDKPKDDSPDARGGDTAERKMALLVGVNVYERRGLSDLKYAERDVDELAKELKAAGFAVRLLKGSLTGKERATLANTQAALAEMLQNARKQDLILIGLAGHGQQFVVKNRDEAFFCPVDGVKNDAATLLGLSDLIATLDGKGGTNLVLVDACRDDTNPDLGRGIDGNIAMQMPSHTAMMLSCSVQQRSYETAKAGGGHGVFFHFVLEGLRGGAANKRGEVTWDRLVPYVRERFQEDFGELIPGMAGKQSPHVLTNLKSSPVLTKQDVVIKPSEKEKPLETEKKEEQKEITLNLGDGVKLKMVRVTAKGNTFWMGSPKTEKDRNKYEQKFDAEEQHEVEFSYDYWLGVTEVTQAQYRAIMKENPSFFRQGGKFAEKVEGLDTDEFPVDHVSWENARAFCRIVTDKLRDGYEYRLPREAEWEYACREGDASKETVPFYLKGGRTSSLTDGQINSTGRMNYLYRPALCGSHPEAVNRLGLYDMHGNVGEWCEDWYGEYPKVKTTDPRGPVSGSHRVCRGGGWSLDSRNARAAYRIWNEPSGRFSDVGFRLARVLVR